MRSVVLGGYGHFGAVIARRLAADDRFEVVVAGRDAHAAHAFAASIGAGAAVLDARAADLARRLADLEPALVVSAAGPFQGQDHAVARAALAAGAHYVDIADGREFVCGIAMLDGEARAAGRLAVSGASSVPALSAAVVDHYAGEFGTLRAIEVGISSSATMPGLATTRAVLGYCGRPLQRWRDGRWVEVRGWQGLGRHPFAGATPPRWICDCDVPDLELFPARYPGVRDVRFRAGVELLPVQLGLWLLAGLVRAGLLRDAASLAPALHRAARSLERFGSGRSAMFVRLAGTGLDGAPHVRAWELHAQRDEGAEVPCIAAVALAKKLAAGTLAQRGARPCVGLVTLAEYEAQMAGLAIRTSTSGGVGGASAKLDEGKPFPL